MDYSPLTQALETHLSNMDGLPDVAWPNVQYSPQPDTAYVEVQHILPPPVQVGFGDTDSLRQDGALQVDVNVPVNSGTKTALALAKSISAHFKRGEQITVDDTYVRMGVANIETGVVSGSHYRLTLLMRYHTIMQIEEG